MENHAVLLRIFLHILQVGNVGLLILLHTRYYSIIASRDIGLKVTLVTEVCADACPSCPWSPILTPTADPPKSSHHWSSYPTKTCPNSGIKIIWSAASCVLLNKGFLSTTIICFVCTPYSYGMGTRGSNPYVSFKHLGQIQFLTIGTKESVNILLPLLMSS